QIQGTLNGLGERCGNANLTSIIPTLMLKPDYAERFETGVTPEKLRTLTHASRILDELLNRAPNRRAPYVGESAFAHKGGIHVSAVQKDPRTYEHVPPEAVGNRRRLLVSDQGGRSNILAELDRIGIAVPKNDQRIARLLDEGQERGGNWLSVGGGGPFLRPAPPPHSRQCAAVLRRRVVPGHGRAPP